MVIKSDSERKEATNVREIASKLN